MAIRGWLLFSVLLGWWSAFVIMFISAYRRLILGFHRFVLNVLLLRFEDDRHNLTRVLTCPLLRNPVFKSGVEPLAKSCILVTACTLTHKRRRITTPYEPGLSLLKQGWIPNHRLGNMPGQRNGQRHVSDLSMNLQRYGTVESLSVIGGSR